MGDEAGPVGGLGTIPEAVDELESRRAARRAAGQRAHDNNESTTPPRNCRLDNRRQQIEQEPDTFFYHWVDRPLSHYSRADVVSGDRSLSQYVARRRCVGAQSCRIPCDTGSLFACVGKDYAFRLSRWVFIHREMDLPLACGTHGYMLLH